MSKITRCRKTDIIGLMKQVLYKSPDESGIEAHRDRFSSIMGVEALKLAAWFSENTSTSKLPVLDATGGLAEFRLVLFPKLRRSEGGEDEFTWKR